MKNYKSLAWKSLVLMIMVVSLFFFTNQSNSNNDIETNSDSKGLNKSSSFIINSTYFKEIAANNYATALLSLSKDKGMEKLHTIDKAIFDVKLSQIAWQLFFNSAIRVYNKDLNRYPIVAYYNPFSDIYFITVWSQVKGEYKIIDAEMLLGDFVRGNSKGLNQTPFWLREKDVPIANLGVSVSLSILAFEEVFKTATAKNWRSTLKILTDTKALKELNYPAISLSSGEQILNVINFSDPSIDNLQLKECQIQTVNILQSIKKGSIDTILITADKTPSQTVKVLKKVSPNWVDDLSLSAVLNNKEGCLVLFSPKKLTTGAMAFSFKTTNNQLNLIRIDILDYQQTYEKIKEYQQKEYDKGILK